MPNRPTYPRIALPPALAARCDALRAQAPTGRPSRQAVVERALAVGLGVLEGCPGAPGGADGFKGAGRAADAPTGQRGGLAGPRDVGVFIGEAPANEAAAKLRLYGWDASARDGVLRVAAPATAR